MKKKLISALLILAMLLPVLTFTGCKHEEGEGYITPTNTEPLFEFKDGAEKLVREDAIEYGEYTLAQENENFKFFFNSEILAFALQDKATGEIWYSNPTITENNKRNKNNLSYQVSLYYLDKANNSQKQLNSFLDCVMNETEDKAESGFHQYYVVNHDGHLRVIYILGEIKPDYIVPTCLEGDYALEVIAKMKEAGYKMAASYISSGAVYSKLTPRTWDSYPSDRQNELMGIAKNLGEYMKEGKTVYIIGDKTKWNRGNIMSQIQEAFLEAMGMTINDRDVLNETFGVKTDAPKTFWIPVDYVLTKDGLNVTIPNEEIQFDKTNLTIANLDLLKYFGCGSQKEEGYLFVPDGSGALINFNNGKTNIISDLRVQIYGQDDGREKILQPYMNQNAGLPVYGVKKASSALFGIIESGDTNVQIVADIAGKSATVEDYNIVYPKFRLCEYDELQFKSAGKTSRIYQDVINSADLSVSYTVLTGDKADYSGMAEFYRNYLINKGVLKQQNYSSIPFNIELIGAFDHKTAFMGVPYTEMKALTTFADCKDLIRQLNEKGIKNISINYKGWDNNGLRNTVANKVKVLKALGGRNGMKDLMDYADSLNVKLYFETELALVYEGKAFDGYSQLTDASRLVTRDVAHHYQYWDDWQMQSKMNDATIASPSRIFLADNNAKTYSAKTLAGLQDLGVKSVSLGSLAWNLPGNYKLKDYYDRDKTAETYAGAANLFKENGMSVMGKTLNAYLLPYVDSIFELSNTSSIYNLADESVPFYQMVIHGCVQYSGEPINLNGDVKTAFLQAVEAGAGLYYRWCYAPNKDVKDLWFSGMYSLSYSSWIDDAIEMYKSYNDLLASTAGATMTKHEFLADGVSKVSYSNGITVYVNYNTTEFQADGITVPAQGFAKGGN